MLAKPFGLNEEVREHGMVTVHRKRSDHWLNAARELCRVIDTAEVGERDLAYFDGIIGRCEYLSECLDLAVPSPERCAHLFEYDLVGIGLRTGWLVRSRP